MVYALHDASLDDVAVDGVAATEGSASFDLKAAFPVTVICIDLVSESWDAVLAKEDGSIHLLRFALSSLDFEFKAFKARSKMAKNLIALQSFVEKLRVDV